MSTDICKNNVMEDECFIIPMEGAVSFLSLSANGRCRQEQGQGGHARFVRKKAAQAPMAHALHGRNGAPDLCGRGRGWAVAGTPRAASSPANASPRVMQARCNTVPHLGRRLPVDEGGWRRGGVVSSSGRTLCPPLLQYAPPRVIHVLCCCCI